MKIQLLFLFLGVFIQTIKSQTVSDTFNTQTQNIPYQTFTVPCGVTSITINAVGASGGEYGALYGKGARMIGTFSVSPGDVLRVRSGRYGANAGINGVGGAGGGASLAINFTTNQVLIVAGGGGGCSINPNNTNSVKVGGNAAVTNSGTFGGQTNQFTSNGGGGGGWTADGGGGMTPNLGGKSYLNGGNGAVGSSTNPSFNAGGFGGGGGGAQYQGMGGGGGGYSGGVGGFINPVTFIITSSQGGGSFNSGTNQINSIAQNGPQVGLGSLRFNGQIIISYSDPLGKPLILGNNSICSGETAILSIQSPTTGYTYYWSNGSTGTSINVNQGGNYTVYAISSCGTSQVSNVFNLVVNTPPAAAVSTTSPSSFCEGGSALLTANTGANLTYQWLNNGINISGATSTSYSAIVSGSYKVIVSNGICSDTSNAISIIVNPIPVINITSDNQTNYCGTSIVQNTLTSNQAQSYLWNTGELTQSISVSQQGVYSVLVTDVNSCQNTESIQITVNSLPSVFAGSDQTICQGESLTFLGTGATTYAWNNNVINNSAFAPIATNNYIVVGTDANGCQDSDTVLVIVNSNSSSQLTQTANNTYTLNGQTYSQSGTYTQVIPNANGCDSTITLNLTINGVAINEVSTTIFNIYPNPAKNQFHIDYDGQINKLEIIDMKGAIVYTTSESKVEYRLPNHIQMGNYLVVIHTDEGIFRKELVVNSSN